MGVNENSYFNLTDDFAMQCLETYLQKVDIFSRSILVLFRVGQKITKLHLHCKQELL